MKLEERIANNILTIALTSENWSSLWGIYQPKEPKKQLQTLKKKKKLLNKLKNKV